MTNYMFYVVCEKEAYEEIMAVVNAKKEEGLTHYAPDRVYETEVEDYTQLTCGNRPAKVKVYVMEWEWGHDCLHEPFKEALENLAEDNLKGFGWKYYDISESLEEGGHMHSNVRGDVLFSDFNLEMTAALPRERKFCTDSADDGILLWIPEYKTFFGMEFGCGVNLSKEDITEGYDAYINYNEYEFDGTDFEVRDGGCFCYISEEKDYADILEAVNDTLSFVYGKVPEYVPLQNFRN